MRLDTDTVAGYLESEGVVPADAAPAVEPLGGGVSNSVFRVEWDDDDAVVKQPFPDLDVEEEWPADVGRVHNEAAAARAYADVLERRPVSGVTVPHVRFEDRDEHVIVISAAPGAARTWKSHLLDGRVDASIAETVGEFLAATHEVAAGDDAIEGEFENYAPFEQLRLAPYHETVAERHPDVAGPIRREIERLRETRSTLVHGDYSPKNVLVDESGDDTALWVLDFEVAHWGDPSFDVAFMLNHLSIKSMYNAERGEEYVAAAESFWESYVRTGDRNRQFETAVLAELGVLLLARVDGKSPVEYVRRTETKDRLRSLAKRLLNADAMTFPEFIAVLRTEVDDA